MARATTPVRTARGWGRVCAEVLERRLILSAAIASADPLVPYLPPQHELFVPGEYLTEPTDRSPREVAEQFVTDHAGQLGLAAGDRARWSVTDEYAEDATGTAHVYLRQVLNGLPVVNALVNVNVAADGRVVSANGGFVGGLKETGRAPRSKLRLSRALRKAAEGLGFKPEFGVTRTVSRPAGAGRRAVVAAPALSLDPVPAELHYVAEPKGVTLAWNFLIRTVDGAHWYDLCADATTGDIVALHDWVSDVSYDVFAPPSAGPVDGPRTLAVAPADWTTSPFGWHDTDGAPGPEYTDTRGNNVFAQEDVDGNNVGGFRPPRPARASRSTPRWTSPEPPRPPKRRRSPTCSTGPTCSTTCTPATASPRRRATSR